MAELLIQACYNTILGIGTVFLMLILMSLIIYCFRFIPMIQAKFKKAEEPAPAASRKKAAPKAVSQAKANLVDDLELVAVISAAIAASEQVPIDSFQVRTIKRRR